MTTRIITAENAADMAAQLAELGATVERSETGYVAKTKAGKEVFRAMVGTGGTYLARWIDGLFDEKETENV